MSHKFSAAVAIFIGLLVFAPLVTIGWMSFAPDVPTLTGPYTLANFGVLFEPSTYELLANSITFSSLTLLFGLLFGFPIAWLVERTDIPFKMAVRSLISGTILIPTFLQAIGWVLLLSPTIGVFNQLLKAVNIPITVNIYTMYGMAFVQGLSFTPIAFFMLSAVFAKMDPALEEAAYANRIGWIRTLRRVTIPLSWPGLLAAIIYMFMLGISVLEVPLIIGLPGKLYLFSSRVFVLTRGASSLPQYGIVGATSIIFLGISLAAAYYYSKVIRKSYRYAVVSGKGYRPRLTELGGWRFAGLAFVSLYFGLSVIFPFASLIWVSLVPFVQPPSWEALSTVSLSAYRYIFSPTVSESFINTILLILIAPTAVILLSLMSSWIVTRSQMRARLLLDRIAMIPLALPNIIIAVALIYISLLGGSFFPVYGTVWILIIAFTISHITFGTRTLNAAMIQIHKDLEEAAAVSGARPSRIMRQIMLPLIWAPIVDGWIWLFLLSFREVTMAATLYINDNAVLSTVVWILWSDGQFSGAAAMSVVLGLAMGVLAVLVRVIAMRVTAQPVQEIQPVVHS
jgi:iron(III) transport system permease protein